MSIKLRITETQSNRLEKKLLESNSYTSMVKTLKKELDNNYQPTDNFIRKDGEYTNKRMISIKIDGELITPEALLNYLHSKYNVNKDFIKQTIIDWINGDIDDNYMLTKNVTLT